MERWASRGVAVVAMAAVAACSGAPAELEGTASRAQALDATNGSNLNGSNLNGSNLNGSNLNGSDPGSNLDSVSFAGARLPSGALDATQLWGGMLVGARNGRIFWGQDFVGATFNATASDGHPVTLRIDSAIQDPAPNADVWRYQVQVLDPTGTWQELCPSAPGGLAVAVNGRWNYAFGTPGGGSKIDDPAVFTFGCQGAAIEKCVAWGYKPWATVNGTPIEPYHSACVRLVRADYCGDGVSHTTNGRWINLYDGLGIQQDTESWIFEAEWDANGARCLSPLNRGLDLSTVVCGVEKLDLTCGARSHFSAGTLLMTETPEGQLGILGL